MQLITAALLAMVAGVSALPSSANQDWEQSLAPNDTALLPQSPCGGLMSKPVCCHKSVLNLVNLGCKPAKGDIRTGPELVASCALVPKRPLAQCCVLGLVSNHMKKAPLSPWLRDPGTRELRDPVSKSLINSNLTDRRIRPLQARRAPKRLLRHRKRNAQ